MSLGVVAQRGNEQAVALAAEIRARIGPAAVAIDEASAEALEVDGTPVESLDACDLVVSIGGDGTFLFAARHLGATPIMGVNLGEVGFLTSVAPDDAVETVASAYEDANEGTLAVRTVPRIDASGDGWAVGPSLNELMVHASQRGMADPIEVTIRVDGDRYDRGVVDGVMVATPTGSTAYNLSERGPLVAPGVETLLVNQMCARGGRPPVAVPLDAEIEIAIESGSRAYVVGDGRAQERIDVPGTVTITRSPHTLHVAGPPVEFFEALDKLA